ncbi:MAG: AAA family ATPase [Candidatus Obscuribacterales bacterium]|nr:AAA family ATPase [Candidatus Obscuribacterales bacterium]
MALKDFKISGYRSIRDVWLKLKQINMIVGPNGSGKSNLYRALYLTSCAAAGRLASSIVEEGGMESILWAGARSRKEMEHAPRVRFSIRVNDYEYNLALGRADDIRPPFFHDDPLIKVEDLFRIKNGHRTTLLRRRNLRISAKDAKGNDSEYTLRMSDNESVLSGLREPLTYPELTMFRQEFLDWRFYHHFRTDQESPLRRPQRSLMTPIMAHNGKDLVPALATIIYSSNPTKFLNALEEAFPGAEVSIQTKGPASATLKMKFPGVSKIFDTSELSDGTLQYLCLLAALLSERPPAFLAINEPETSLHPRLYEPLARLIVNASHQSQLWITTHSQELADHVLDMTGYSPLELEKIDGETRLKGVRLGEHNSKEYLDEDDGEDT